MYPDEISMEDLTGSADSARPPQYKCSCAPVCRCYGDSDGDSLELGVDFEYIEFSEIDDPDLDLQGDEGPESHLIVDQIEHLFIHGLGFVQVHGPYFVQPHAEAVSHSNSLLDLYDLLANRHSNPGACTPDSMIVEPGSGIQSISSSGILPSRIGSPMQLIFGIGDALEESNLPITPLRFLDEVHIPHQLDHSISEESEQEMDECKR